MPAPLPALLFIMVIAHRGVRLGRATHVVDMASEDTRAAYTAFSNTVIGVILLAGGAFGIVAEAFGEAVLLGIFALMAAAGAVAAGSLTEVQQAD